MTEQEFIQNATVEALSLELWTVWMQKDVWEFSSAECASIRYHQASGGAGALIRVAQALGYEDAVIARAEQMVQDSVSQRALSTTCA